MEGVKDEVIAGRKPLIEGLRSGRGIEKVVLLPGSEGEEIRMIRHLCTQKEIPVQVVPAEKFNYLLRRSAAGQGINHQGVLALLSPVAYVEIEELLRQLSEQTSPLIVFADKVTDVRNLGAIARSALCFGASALMFPSEGSARMSADAIKTSAGALLHLPLCRVKSLSLSLKMLKAHGYHLLAAEQRGAADPAELDWDRPVVLMLGSEGEGLGQEVLRQADEVVGVPMQGSFDSLNVSVAAGILLYEAGRKRKSKS